MKFDNIIKTVGISGKGRAASGAVFGTSPRFVTPAPSGGFVKKALSFVEGVQHAQARADEIATRTEKVLQNPVTRAFLGAPPKRQAPWWMRSAASIVNATPRYSAASLSGGNFFRASGDSGRRFLATSQGSARGWQPLGPFAGADRNEGPLLARGPVTNFENPSIAGTGGLLLGSGAEDPFRPYNLSWFTTRLFDLPVLGRLGSTVQDFFGLFSNPNKFIVGWLPSIGRFLKQAARRAWQLYPRDPEGHPIPPWNLRLYSLAWAAYRLDDYGAVARFLDEIGADSSPDNVLFVQDLLAPAFDPKRPDRRTNWWLLDPAEARRALRKRLSSLSYNGVVERCNGEISYLEDPEDDENPNDPYFYVVRRTPRAVSAEKAFFDGELPALLLQELAAVLPPRQYEVVSLASRGWTYELIAHEMGITEGAVKAHMHKVRNNPLVAEVLFPQSALRLDTTQIRGRTHRE